MWLLNRVGMVKFVDFENKYDFGSGGRKLFVVGWIFVVLLLIKVEMFLNS